jgi:hypothetical protein
MEVVSQAEHLRRLVADAMAAANQAAHDRAARGLRDAIESLRATSASFGQLGVAEFFGAHAASAAALEPAALRAFAEAAELLSDPRGDPALLSDRFGGLTAGRAVDSAIGAGLMATGSPTPTSIPVTEPRLADVLVERHATPSGSGLRALLQSGLAGFRSLDREPLAVPAAIDEDLPMIDAFVYRGRAALDRARELRDSLRGRRSAPEREELDELFDLLDLAAVE